VRLGGFKTKDGERGFLSSIIQHEILSELNADEVSRTVLVQYPQDLGVLRLSSHLQPEPGPRIPEPASP
jgi:hypothetical protein